MVVLPAENSGVHLSHVYDGSHSDQNQFHDMNEANDYYPLHYPMAQVSLQDCQKLCWCR